MGIESNLRLSEKEREVLEKINPILSKNEAKFKHIHADYLVFIIAKALIKRKKDRSEDRRSLISLKPRVACLIFLLT